MELSKEIPNSVWQIVLMGLLGLSGVIFMPALLRGVDAQIMANVLVAQVVVYYLLLIVQFGFNWSSPVEFARANGNAEVAYIWRRSVRIKVALFCIVAFFSAVLSYWRSEVGALYLIGFGLLLIATAANSNWLLQARSDFFSGVVFALGGVLVSLLLTFFLVNKFFSSSLLISGLGVVFVFILPASFLGLGSWWLSQRLFSDETCEGGRGTWQRTDASHMWSNIPIVLTQLLQLVSATLGTVVVSSIADVVTTNAYAAMERLFNLSASVAIALYMAAYPRLATLFYEERSNYWARVVGLLKISGALGLAAMMLFAIFGQTILNTYVSEPLAIKVSPVILVFTLWLGLYLSQHVLTGYFIFAQRNSMVFIVNLLILFVTVGVGYPMARYEPVFWVYGMLAGQVVAVTWLILLYHRDRRTSVGI